MIQNIINKFLEPYKDVTFDPKNSAVIKLIDQTEKISRDQEHIILAEEAKEEVRRKIMIGNYKRYGMVTISYLIYFSTPFILYYEWKYLKKYFKK